MPVGRIMSALHLPFLTTPARNPDSGRVLTYFKSDGLLYKKDASGTESPVNILVSPTDAAMARSTGDAIATSTTPVAIPGLSIAANPAGAVVTYEVTISADLTCESGVATGIVELLVNGVADPSAINYYQSVAPRSAQSKTWIVSVSAATTFSARLRLTANGQYRAFAQHTTMTVAKVASSAVAAPTTTWTNMQLTNGWVNNDSGLSLGGSGRPAQYRVRNGEFIMRGFIRSGTIGQVAFVVPAGMRPEVQMNAEIEFVCPSAATFSLVDINASTGAVSPMTGSNGYIGLSGIRFVVAGY